VYEVERSVHVDAGLEAVFSFMDDPENQAAVTPSLGAVEAVEELENGGKRVRYTYSMVAVPLDGTVEAVEYDPPNRIVWTLNGAIEGEIRQRYEPEDGGTRATYAADYRVPLPVVGRLAAPLIRWYNRREVRRTLENLKRAVEAERGRENRSKP
jgi:carbon monoxide dehydrogenase subunit G